MGDLELSRLMASHSAFAECLWLIKQGIPFDVAFSLPPAERLAMVVVFGQFDGGVFDWDTGTWRKRNA